MDTEHNLFVVEYPGFCLFEILIDLSRRGCVYES